jgi:hypothetical protein
VLLAQVSAAMLAAVVSQDAGRKDLGKVSDASGAGIRTDLAGYRQMVINHETGHFLGYNHMACPGKGKLAPVMQTQTIALNGCLPNSWPYPDRVHFVTGPPASAARK